MLVLFGRVDGRSGIGNVVLRLMGESHMREDVVVGLCRRALRGSMTRGQLSRSWRRE